MYIKTLKETLEELKTRLESGLPFCYNRFGDGGLMMVDGWRGDVSDHYFSPKLQELLKLALKTNDPDYLMGLHCGFQHEEWMTPKSFKKHGNDEALQEIVKREVPDWGEHTFYSAVALQAGMVHEPLLVRDILKLIRGKKTVIVAGEHLAGCEKFFGDRTTFISAPRHDAFDVVEDLMTQVYAAQPEILVTACGMAGILLQHYAFIDQTGLSSLNFGSFMDAVQGLETRSWIIENEAKIKEFRQALETLDREAL